MVPEELMAQLDVLARGEFTPSFLREESQPPRGGLWIVVDWKRHKTLVPQMLHALQLLAQLARTNERGWLCTLSDLWPVGETRAWLLNQEQHRGSEPPVIGLYLTRLRDGNLAMLHTDRFVGSLPSAHTRGSTNASDPPPTIPIHFHLDSLARMTTTLQAIQELTTPSATSPPNARPYHVESISMCPAVTIDDAFLPALSALSAIARHGVEIARLPHFVAANHAFHGVASFVLDLQTLLPPCSIKTESVSTRVDSVSCSSMHYNSSQQLQEAVLSAIAASRSVRAVEVDCTESPSNRFVRWLAFSLFSTSAQHDIRTLTLNGSLDNAARIRSFQNVIEVRDPLAALFQDERSSIEVHERLRISASRFFLLGPNDAPVALPVHTGLRVITRTDEWWSVLLPAWGRAWVHTTDASVTDRPEEGETRGRRSIRELVLFHGSVAMLPWLALVGNGVERLTFHGRITGPLEILTLSNLKQTFPNLTGLHLQSVRIDRLQILFERNEPECWTRLDSLFFNSVSINNGDLLQDLVLLLRALQDPTHRLAKTLRSLTLILSNTVADYVPFLDEVLAMLQTNRKLQWLCIKLPIRVFYTAEIRDAIRTQRGVQIQGRKAPLGIREKCAALSAVADQRHLACHHFDSRIWTIIFQFAARCRLRHVEFDE